MSQQQQPLAQINTNAAAPLQSNDVTAVAQPDAAAADDELPPLEDDELRLGNTSSTSFCTIERTAYETVFWSPPDTVIRFYNRDGWIYTVSLPLRTYLQLHPTSQEEESSRVEELSTKFTN